MNKYKLVPYLVLSKEDALLENMQEQLTLLLRDSSIDSVSKRALYEDLLNKISRFKEYHSMPTTIQLPQPPPQFQPPSTFPTTDKSETISSTTSIVSPSQITNEQQNPDHIEQPQTTTIDNAKSLPFSDERNHNVEDDGEGTFSPVITPRAKRMAKAEQKAEQSKANKANIASNKQKQLAQQLSPSETRKGTTYTDPNLDANRRLQRSTRWTVY